MEYEVRFYYPSSEVNNLLDKFDILNGKKTNKSR